jgi:hypothetical protein
MGQAGTTVAVIMGDLVGSQRAASPEQLHAQFNAAVQAQNRQRSLALISPLTITLGDEFQGLATSFVMAAEIVRAIRLDLLANAIDCRFAIGSARLRTPVNVEKAWNMMGPGLSEARAKLNEKRSDTVYCFSIPDEPVLATLLDACGATLTMLERNWTDTQRHDIQALIGGESPGEIAKRRRVSVHTVYKVRNSGHYDLYRVQWQAISDAMSSFDRNASTSGTAA